MKETKKRKEQYQIADALFEMGMDFEVIEKISGVNAQELLLNKANLVDFDSEINHNNVAKKNKPTYQEPRIEGTNKRGSNPK